MAKRYTTDEVVAMMSAPSPNVEMLKQPASPLLDPAQINAAERELSQPPPEYPRPETVGTAITDAAGMDRPATGSSGNMALQNYEAQEVFPIDQTPAPQRPAGGGQTLYPSAQETKPSLPKQRYTTDEVMSLYMQQSKPRYSTKDVMLKMVQPLDDPTMPRLGRDEYFKAKEIKKSLQESGDLPSNWEETKTAVGGFLLTVPDAFATALYKTDKSQGWFEIGGAGFNPALALSETWRRSPATLAYSSEMARQGYAGMAEGLRVMGGPKYRVAESGEFVMDEEESAGGQFGQIDPRNIVDRYKAKGLTLRPVNDEDKKDFEYQQWNKKMDRDLQVERARTAEMPPEFAYRMLVGSAAAVSDYNTGRNDFANITGNVGPMQSQAVVGSMLVDPLTYTTFGAAATRIGISAAAKGATARSLDIIGRAVNKAVKPAEVPLTQIDRFRKIVMPPAKVAGAYGLATGAAYAADVMQLPPELKTAAYTAAGLYTAYRGGLGVLRFVGKRFPEASVILRESADPTNGLDLAARKVVASNPNVPGNVRARLERPSQFLSMESTPQRLSQNMALSPGTRKVMEKLSNWYVVQGVRGASDVATGAVKGAIVAAPFAELTRLGGDERSADAMYGIGPALGAFGGAANRVFGARGRTIGRAESDIGRMLVDVQAGNKELRSKIGADGKAALQSWNFYNSEIGRMLTDVELAAGDVDALVKNRSFDELARIAAMQGFFRSKVDYIPLGAADFALNADQHGADGSAGFFLSVPDSERARIFVNVDARRADVEPHEFGEAFFSTGAFSPEQMAAMRSGVDARYGLDGVQKRANEYAESLIKASNATNFPNEKLVVSAEQIQAKVNELAQAELQRGGNDPLDWVRREIMVEEWRMAGMDFASIRRNIPEGANPVKFIEDVLGASARALGLSGVRVDPETGIPITPEQLFRENPVAADDPVVMSNLKAYTKAYRAWLNDPAHEVPSGVKIAPDGRAESLANNPSVIFDANGQNPLATRDPQTGQVRWKNDKDRAKDAKVRGQQIRNVAGRDLVASGSPQFGPKKTASGRIRISGRRLPAALELQNHWKPQLEKIRRLEALADGDESTQVLYVAMGNSADKVKTSRPQDIVAINREMVFDEWVVQGKNNDLYGQFLDLTTIRNRAMRAISERNPALDPARGGPGYSLQSIMDDVYQWMADKRANKDGAATIGADRKNVVNALINPGTNLNREKNPISGAFGRGSAIKTLLVDNIMAVSGTGRKGAAMDYNWANGNFMPDKPAPRPNMDSDLELPNRMPSALPQAGMAMPDGPVRGERADIPLNPRARRAAFISDRGEVRSTGRATHFETNEDLGPDFLAIGAGHLGEDGFFRFGSQTMDDAMGESPATSAAAAARYNQSVYDQGKRPSAMLEEPPGLERAGGRGQTGQAMPDVDADYMAAVERGNTKAAQKMVDDAAERSGFNIKAFHGTPEGGFTQFKETDGGLFFSSRESIAQGYTYFRNPWLSPSERGQVYRAQLRMENPLKFDAGGARHNNIPFPGREYKRTVFGNIPEDAVSVEDAAKLAFAAGHDGVIIENVMDGVSMDNKTRSTVYAIKSPDQAKITDPIARDSAGNIIPPSKRFATGRTRGQAMPDVDAQLWTSDEYKRPEQAKVDSAIKRLQLQNPSKPEPILIDVWGGGVARYRRGWQVTHQNGTLAFYSDRAGRTQSMNVTDQTRVAKDVPRRSGQAMPDVMDRDYVAAVKRDDVEAMQKIVDRKASKQGYTSPLVFHGSSSDSITSFSKDKLGSNTGAGSAKLGFFFAENEKTSTSYTGPKINVNDAETLGEILAWTDLTPDWDASFDNDGLPYVYIENDAWKLNPPKEVAAAINVDQVLGESFNTLELDADMALLDAVRANKKVDWAKTWGTKAEFDETKRMLKELTDEEYAKLKEYYEGIVSRREFEYDSDADLHPMYQTGKLTDAEEILSSAAERGQFVAIGLDGAYTIQPDGKDFVLKYKDVTIEAADNVEDLKSAANSHANNYLDDISSDSSGGKVYKAYLKYTNPLVHDYKGAAYREESYYSVIMRAKKGGHDGVVMKNTYDGGPKDTIHVVFEPEQVKFADPITTDDQGKVILPSKRFDSRSMDARYGIAGAALAAGAMASQEEQ